MDLPQLEPAIRMIALTTAEAVAEKLNARIEELERHVLRLNAITMELSAVPSLMPKDE